MEEKINKPDRNFVSALPPENVVGVLSEKYNSEIDHVVSNSLGQEIKPPKIDADTLNELINSPDTEPSAD